MLLIETRKRELFLGIFKRYIIVLIQKREQTIRDRYQIKTPQKINK